MIKKYLNFNFSFEKAFFPRKNKVIEFQLYKPEYDGFFDFLKIQITSREKTDHGGWYFEVDILDISFTITYYDSRHWCDECDTYETEKCIEQKHGETE